MSDASLEIGPVPDDLLERLFGSERLKRGWRVLVPANDDRAKHWADDDLHPAFIAALLKRRRTW